MRKRTIFLGLLSLSILSLGLLAPTTSVIPVMGASRHDWNKVSFWHSPWGKSGVHKGIDIFAPSRTPVIASSTGVVLFTGHIKLGGNVVLILGSKWRIYYYAHLNNIRVQPLHWVSQGTNIASVGNSGNAIGKPPHLHYSVLTLLPYPWHISFSKYGYWKMFYLDPASTFNAQTAAM